MFAKLRFTQWRDWAAPAQVALGVTALAIAITQVPNGDSVIASRAEAAGALCPNAPVEQSMLAAISARLALEPAQEKSWQDLVVALERVCVPARATDSTLEDKLAGAEAVSQAQLNALRRARRAIQELRPQLTPEQRDVIDHLPVGTGL
jgi:hypothetical protein